VLGEVGLSGFDDEGTAQIGSWVGAAHRGQGHATRAVRLLTAWALTQHGIREVRATVDPANRASLVVLRRAGFHAESADRWTRT
jgi:RimJ/RimL family protein N-acetyltransferase